jgi:hypothetical protein
MLAFPQNASAIPVGVFICGLVIFNGKRQFRRVSDYLKKLRKY